MIVERMNELASAIDDLREKFIEYGANADLLMRPFDLVGEISDWRYSTADNFDPEPYHNEIAGMNKGRVLKKKYDSPFLAKLKGQYSSGFVEGKLVLTIYPSEIDSTLSLLYFMDLGEVRYRLAIFYKLNEGRAVSCKLRSVQSCFAMDVDTQVFLLKGEFDEVSISAYKSENGFVCHAYSWNSKWPIESVRHLHYCEGELVRVTGPAKDGGEIEVWKG